MSNNQKITYHYFPFKPQIFAEVSKVIYILFVQGVAETNSYRTRYIQTQRLCIFEYKALEYSLSHTLIAVDRRFDF